MIDRPDAARLLNAMAETLSDEILPATRGGAQHAVRVVANLCRILEREVRAGPEPAERTVQALEELLGRKGDLASLVAALDRRLQQDEAGDADFEARAYAVILEDVRRRLAIDRPGYEP
ncbi:MAG: DUF6285 domain-containing protein [bacterium]